MRHQKALNTSYVVSHDFNVELHYGKVQSARDIVNDSTLSIFSGTAHSSFQV